MLVPHTSSVKLEMGICTTPNLSTEMLKEANSVGFLLLQGPD